MCFSPEASFGASAALTTIGVIAYKKADKSDLRLLAMIPLLFGIQQFMEGLVWLSLSYDSWLSYRTFSTYAFIFFAWEVWPLFISISMYIPEKNKVRKNILLGLIGIGVLVTSILIYIILSIGVEGEVQDCSIAYRFDFQHKLEWVFVILYFSTTVLPGLVSSLGKVWLLGVLNIVTFSVTRIFYQDHIISIWCFFAAITSAVILYIIIDEMKRRNPVDVD